MKRIFMVAIIANLKFQVASLIIFAALSGNPAHAEFVKSQKVSAPDGWEVMCDLYTTQPKSCYLEKDILAIRQEIGGVADQPLLQTSLRRLDSKKLTSFSIDGKVYEMTIPQQKYLIQGMISGRVVKVQYIDKSEVSKEKEIPLGDFATAWKIFEKSLQAWARGEVLVDTFKQSIAYKEFGTKYKVEAWPKGDALWVNPFVYQGKTVAIVAHFEEMSSATEGLFQIGGRNIVFVSDIPNGVFTSERWVVLAGTVLGKREVQLPLLGKVAVPHLKYINNLHCLDESERCDGLGSK